MRNILEKLNLKILLGTILIILTVVLVSNLFGVKIFSSVVGFITTPMQQLTDNVTDSVKSTAGKTIEELEEENAQLQQKLNEMIALTVDYYDLKRENEQNAKYLELKEANNDYKFVSASVIGRGSGELFYNFTIDQGSLVDIKKYDPVITEKGLVGWISEVHQTYSKVTTILSPETKVSVIDQVNNENGITIGSLKYADLGVLKMNYVSSENTMKKGDIIVTAGAGGVYPRDLPVGEIEDIYQLENSSDIDVIIRPYEDIKNIKNIFVITDFLGQGDAIPDVNN
ncbi:MAG: rod shape-determining protein MreC [Clostridia bacterium]|nr:rod shape-determining protein MreC [Clostridia bacterium]